MNWFERLIPSRIRTEVKEKNKKVPEGLWRKCAGCEEILYKPDVDRNMGVCPKCSHHNRIGARRRLDLFLDEQDQVEIAADLIATDPLEFNDSKKYKDRLAQAKKATNEKDALVVMQGRVKGLKVVAMAFEFKFMGGSMGSVVGEKFVQGVNAALDQHVPLVCFAASGGARMQESLFSLFQMAKTSAALTKLSKRGLPFVSVMTDPTMGGVSASFAMLGDLNIGEPGALIGFAGPRVIKQTVRETLPEGFQRSEFLLEHGAIDMIIDRRQLRAVLSNQLSIMVHEEKPEYTKEPPPPVEEPPTETAEK